MNEHQEQLYVLMLRELSESIHMHEFDAQNAICEEHRVAAQSRADLAKMRIKLIRDLHA